MANNQCNEGLDDRCRDEDGTIRKKRSDTLVKRLRQEYGDHFAPGTRSDSTLGKLLEKQRAESLSEYLKRRRK